MSSAWVLLCALGLLVAAPARAEPERPWAAGVSQDDQTRAKELFARGNELLDQGGFAAALELYRQATAIWDHPAIRYNLAVALLNLERPIEAYRELKHSLRFGPAPFEPEVYPQALAHQRLLRSQIVELHVECVDAGTQLQLDGKPLELRCPGSATELVLPGRHDMTATKPGHLTHAFELTPVGGETPRLRIDLVTAEEATVHRRRWARWKPWVVVGAGTAVAIAGLGFELQSAATFRSYDNAVSVLCPVPCETLPGVVTDAYDDGKRQNRIAIGLLAIGGTALATGAVLLVLNRRVSERRPYPNPIVTADVGNDRTTVSLAFPF